MAATPQGRRFGLAAYLWVAAISALAGFVAVYAGLWRSDNAVTVAAPETARPSQPATQTPAGATNPLSRGEMAGFVFKTAPAAPPDVAFKTGDGEARTLGAWRGKVVLLNLWATWCAPCRKEMPALDSLQRELGGDAFEVVALAVDRAGADAVKKFLDETNVKNLGVYVDDTARAGTALKAVGMPTTILLDREGRELGRLVGPATWDGPDAQRLIEAAIGRTATP